MTTMVVCYRFQKHQIIYCLRDVVVISLSVDLWIYLHPSISASRWCYR